ncbi:Protein O-mannosyl-transferase TMTC4 (Transmembrane and TPR repeat-containing protein 4) [Durusdinium trenchii]|uniref:Protein O-mannosyl-transferase TMTC4 (Transmembrane and TPR repeat-containing protein 4) n=1 Tax=Durusdinium trenchii TaxID=1381693 RepID=A0ABP0PW77_9DINO
MATVAVFLVIREFTARNGPAVLGGLLFGLHPLQVEPVAWISEARGLLSGLLGLLAIWAYVRFARELPERKRSSAAWYVGASLCFVLALLSKSSAVSVVPMVAVIDWLLLKRKVPSIALSLALWAAAAVGMAWMMTSQQSIGSIAYHPPVTERVVMAGDAVAFYLGKLVWPVQLCADYGWYPQFMREQSWFYILPLVPLAVLVVSWLLRRRLPFFVGLLLFVAGLFPVLGLVPFTYQNVSLVADRFVYLSMLGPALVLGLLFRNVSGKWIVVSAVALMTVLIPLSWQQSQIWRTDLRLAIHTREVNRRSIFAASTIAQNMMHQGERELAFDLCVEIAQLNPNSARAFINLAQVYSFNGQTDGAIRVLGNALSLHPTSSLAHRLMAESLEKKDQLEEAVKHYRLALQYGRQDADRAALRIKTGALLMQLKRPQEAAEEFQVALSMLPQPAADIWLGLAQAQIQLGELEAALDSTNTAEAALPPSEKASPEVLMAIAQTYQDLGQSKNAERLAKQAAAIYRQDNSAEGVQAVERLIESWRTNSQAK